MSFLSIPNPLSAVSKAVESVCDAVLPKQLEFVGDLAALGINLKSGNYLQALDDFRDLAQDLPKQLKDLQGMSKAGGGLGAFAAGTALWEPVPPPAYRSIERTPPHRTSFGVPPARAGRADAPGGDVAAPATTGKAGGEDSIEVKSKSAKTKSSKTESKATDESPDASSTTKTTSDTKTNKTDKSTDTASTKTTKEKGDVKDANAFFSLSDKGLMDAVRNGTVPDSVRNDPAQMQRLQVRMNDISQMNQLITTMLNAIHEMNKQVIQNIRV